MYEVDHGDEVASGAVAAGARALAACPSEERPSSRPFEIRVWNQRRIPTRCRSTVWANREIFWRIETNEG